MANYAYVDVRAQRPMSEQEFTVATRGFGCHHPETDRYDSSRLDGDLCSCKGNGQFNLLPKDSPECKEGGKRYMACRVCDSSSHL